MDNLFIDRTKFETLDGEICYFNKVIKGRIIFCWKELTVNSYQKEYSCCGLNPRAFSKETLEEIGAWDKLDKSIRRDIEKGLDENKQKVQERMEKARRSRKKKDPNLPDELVCECGYKTKANWSYLNKKADKLGIPAMDLVKNYKCQKCNPTKGRRKKS